jgi:hypothetical protein
MIPQPKLNGGLYTGEPFYKDAPWANVPVVPDVDYMTNVNLRSANPPPGAIFQYPGNVRPGNNYQKMPGVEKVTKLAQACVSPDVCGKKDYEIKGFDGKFVINSSVN